jgi:hypothetical protein
MTETVKERKYRVIVGRVKAGFAIAILPFGYHLKPVNLKPLAFDCRRTLPSEDGARRKAEWLLGPLAWRRTGTRNYIRAVVTLTAKSSN